MCLSAKVKSPKSFSPFKPRFNKRFLLYASITISADLSAIAFSGNTYRFITFFLKILFLALSTKNYEINLSMLFSGFESSSDSLPAIIGNCPFTPLSVNFLSSSAIPFDVIIIGVHKTGIIIP